MNPDYVNSPYKTIRFTAKEYRSLISLSGRFLDYATHYELDKHYELTCQQIFESIQEGTEHTIEIPVEFLGEIPLEYELPASWLDYIKQGICKLLKNTYFYYLDEGFRLSGWDVLAPLWQDLLKPRSETIRTIASKTFKTKVKHKYKDRVEIILWTKVPSDLEVKLAVYLNDKGLYSSLNSNYSYVLEEDNARLREYIKFLENKIGFLQ